MVETALVRAEEYEIIKAGTESVMEIIRENLGSGGITQGDLDRAHIPSGGATSFEVPTLEGSDMAKTITGVIIGHRLVRVYWREGFDSSGGGSPPDCYSDDGEKGIGDPGGHCYDCPFSKFGTARDGEGRGQACQNRMLLFIMRSHSFLPLVVNLPPTSLGVARKFLLRLGDAKLPYWGAVTEISLVKDKNAGGIEYAKAAFRVAGRLDAETAGKFAVVKEQFAPHLARVSKDAAIAND